MSQYAYQPLGRNKIRLITFEKDSNPPAFSLRHCNMRRASGKYICLSYCWDVAVSPHPVLCNGKELQVQTNLYDALIQLARRNGARDFWIDAICINQPDRDEKGSQIQLMGQIFERAASVFVWLGTTSETENEDMMSLLNLRSTSQFILENEGRRVMVLDLVDVGLPPLDSLFWESLGNILRRSWFRRLWVIQEVTLNRSSFVLLGDQSLPFGCLYDPAVILYGLVSCEHVPSSLGASWAEINHVLLVAMLCRAITRLQFEVPDRRTSSLSARTHLLLAILRDQEVSHLADRVHGMLGMFKHKFVKTVATNADNTVAETYQSFAVASLLADRRLSLLHFVSPTRAVYDLPSWCPDLSRLPPDDNLGANDSGISIKYSSGILKSRHRTSIKWQKRLSQLIPRRMMIPTLRATKRFLPVSNTLLVKGLIIDKIARVVSDHPSWDFSSSSMAQIERWEQECWRISQTTLKCPDTIPMPYVRTLIGDPHPEEIESWDLRAAYISVVEAIKTRDHRIRRGPELTDPASHYFSLMSDFCRWRRFMATIGNRIGLCPPHSKQGDLICILLGARSPFVLRRIPNTENFQLIGQCYVDGLMYGEAFRIKREQRLKDMMFPLI